jgi:spore photoproduct lyase
LNYELGGILKEKYARLPWFQIESHNKIPEFSSAENRDYPKLKQHL